MSAAESIRRAAVQLQSDNAVTGIPELDYALADLLHLVATRCEQMGDNGQAEGVIAANVLGYDQALAVAGAVLGEPVPA